jgi:tRNA pseudouridine55 synthase
MLGFLLINKPVGITSFQCVQYIRRIIGKKIKIGHAGTLDSFADGLLIIGIGREATRELSVIMQLDKRYCAEGKLGILTDTHDHTGTTLMQEEVPHVDEKTWQKIAASFGTSYAQTPPIFSALKYNGKQLSSWARGASLSLEELSTIAMHKTRTIQLYDLSIVPQEHPSFIVQAHVSHGTYIRSLVRDIGIRLGTQATTYALTRLSIGPFLLANAIDLHTIKDTTTITAHLQPLEAIFNHIKEYKY